MENSFHVYADGSFGTDNGIGSWSYIILHHTERSGRGTCISSNEAELWAALSAIVWLPENSHAYLYTDSTFVLFISSLCSSPERLSLWMKRPSATSYLSRVQEFQKLTQNRSIICLWTPRLFNHYSSLCDRRARAKRRRYKQPGTPPAQSSYPFKGRSTLTKADIELADAWTQKKANKIIMRSIAHLSHEDILMKDELYKPPQLSIGMEKLK